MEEKGLLAKELLENVFRLFSALPNAKLVKLSRKAYSEIANDSDWHRTRVGYFGYEEVILLKGADKEWALALGHACGAYPADPFSADLSAVPMETNGKDEDLEEAVSHALSIGYFYNSLIFALASGELVVKPDHCSRFKDTILRNSRFSFQDFVAQELVMDPTVMTGDLRPFVTKPRLYKPQSAQTLFEVLKRTLEI
ncbi:MAG TPA: hypothetical protein VFQ60_05025 [Patescibacteria group bacterium]|nr:hypothetical protein [Patescibacteria group bacterium]